MVYFKSLFQAEERNKVSSLGEWRGVKKTMDVNNQHKHTKARWTQRHTTYHIALFAISSLLQCNCLHKGINVAAIMYANSTDQLMRLKIRMREISVISYAKMFDQLSDLGFSRLFRFCRPDILCLALILGWARKKNKINRNGYLVAPLLFTCAVLRCLFTSDRRITLEHVFCKFSSQLSEKFCNALHLFMTAR